MPVQGTTILTTTTASSDGGFDGWVDGWDPQVKPYDSPTLQVGNYSKTYARADTIFMFNISDLGAILASDVVKATLKYYVIATNGTADKNVDHILKTSQSINVTDNPSEWTVNTYNRSIKTGESQWLQQPATWLDSTPAGSVASIEVTDAFKNDLTNSRVYSSYRLIQLDSLDSKIGNGWGQQIASSENTGSYLVPTLEVEVPEPATIGFVVLGLTGLWRRRN